MAYSYSKDEWDAAVAWIATWCPVGTDRADARRLLKPYGRDGTRRIMEGRIARRNARLAELRS